MSHGKTWLVPRSRGPGGSRRPRLGPVVTAAMVSAILLASCAEPPPELGRPATSDVTGAGSGSSSIASRPAQPGPSGLPPITCARFVPDSPCTPYRSIRALDHGMALPWAGDGAVTASLQSVDGELLLASKTPCGPVSAKATLDHDVMRVHDIAVGAVGCPAEQGEQQQWFLELLRQDLSLSYTGGQLHWRAGTSGIDFERDPL